MSHAHEAIRNLLGTYCALMDAADFAGLGDLFADAVLADEQGNVFARGQDEIRDSWVRQTRLYEGSPRTRHITANTVIELSEDERSASATSSYVVFQAALGLPLQPIITGGYRDSFARGDDGRWRFTERRFAVDQVGDLSHHLVGLSVEESRR